MVENIVKNNLCIIHIGMHKTGTSSIQDTLYANLEDLNFHYVNLGHANHSSDMFSLFSEYPEKNHSYKKRGLTKEQVTQINEKIKIRLSKDFNLKKAKNYIISGEDISTLKKNELMKLKYFLDDYFEEIMIVGYVRPPISYMESAFQQLVKGGYNRLNLIEVYPKYREKFEKFDIVFGREFVHLWKFNPKELIGRDAVLDFCHQLGIKIDANKIIKSNESISKEALSLLYVSRKFGSGYGVGPNVISENSKMIAVLQKIGNTKIRFSSSLVAPILSKKIDDIKWIENRIGKTLFEKREDDLNDISSEKDLLEIKLNSLNTLCDLTGSNYLTNGVSENIQSEVVKQVDMLRTKPILRIKNVKNRKYNFYISLGNNCEVGLQLRRWGYEESSFFRFVYSPFYALVNVLGNKFNEIYEYKNIKPIENDMIVDKKSNIRFHSKMYSKLRDGIRCFVDAEEKRLKIYQEELSKIHHLIEKMKTQFSLKGKVLFFLKSDKALKLEQINNLVINLKSLGGVNFDIVYLTLENWNINWTHENVFVEKLSKFAPGEDAHDADIEAYNILFTKYSIPKEKVRFSNELLTDLKKEEEFNTVNLFDINWSNYYEINNIDDRSINPIRHYLNNWRIKNLIVDNKLDTFYYLDKYPDVKNANMNPLIHYYTHGISEGRKGRRNE